jgi:hypothetical protein
VIGAFVASTVVALVQYVRSRDRRLLALAGGFLLPAFALSRGWWQGWSDLLLGAVCLAGLVAVLVLPTREPAVSGRRRQGPRQV